MPFRYAAHGVLNANTGATIKTAGDLYATTGATTLRRGNIYYIADSVEQAGTMADATLGLKVSRTTTAGTGSIVAANPLDTTDAAALLIWKQNQTAEPTYTSLIDLWFGTHHVRSTLQIQLQPDSHFVVPNVDVTGIGITIGSALYVGKPTPFIHYIE